MATKQFTSWSFTRYSDYRTCPAKAKYKHLDRLPEPKSEALARGSAIHEKAEKYLKSGGARLPKELSKFKTLFKALRQKRKEDVNRVWVEESWAFTKDWKPTRWDDWNGCALRIKVDCAEVVVGNHINIYDWKTGKYRPEQHESYMEQLELCALGALTLHPNVVVTPALAYLDTGDIYPKVPMVYEGEGARVVLADTWAKRVAPMLNDTVFAPTPSYGCRWCAYRKEVGGPCAF